MVASKSDSNCENAASSRNCEFNLTLPATFLYALICAAEPTEADKPTDTAGLIPLLNKSVSRKICPSVMEITFIGMCTKHHPFEFQL